jgi:hypothetical protein
MVVVVGSLASCGGRSSGGSGAAGGGASPSVPPTASAPASAAPSQHPPSRPVPSAGAPGGGSGELTLTGRVEEGVEPGCLIMRYGGRTYELMSNNHTVVRAGAQVVVTGHVVTGMASYCQQGLIFQVTSARQG